MRRRQVRRAGTMIPIFAVSIIGLFAFIALAIDLGMLAVARTECQNAVDAAALTGCRTLDNKPSTDSAYENNKAAALTAIDTVIQNNILLNTNFQTSHIQNKQIGVYYYNTSVTPPRFDLKYTRGTGESWSAVDITVSVNQPMFFAKVLGIASMPNGARAVAVHRPRDVAIILDFSGSMKFGSTLNWADDSSRGGSYVDNRVMGLLSPDTRYPTFGHYARYNSYSTTATLNYTNFESTTVSNRPHPFYVGGSADAGYYNGSGERMAPSNYTVETPGGPPIVEDFLTDSAPPTGGGNISSVANLRKAFHHWDPPSSGGNLNTYTAPTFSYGGYNASTGLMPTPDSYKDQTDMTGSSGTIVYDGDRYPRKRGKIFTSATNWDPFTTNGAAITAADLLGWWNSSTYTSGAMPTNPAIVNTPAGRTWTNFRDATWERYGYDLDIDHYVTNRGTTWDPRFDWNLSTSGWSGATGWRHNRASDPAGTITFRPQMRTTNLFKGYSMGPGYWGKTFFIWPPDPRWGGGTGTPDPTSPSTTNPVKDTNGNWICDWRKRFFLRSDGTAFTAADNIDSIMLDSGVTLTLSAAGWTATPTNHVLNYQSGTATYRVNYNAVLDWIKSGPQTLPSNLRLGRILYYTTIPDTIPSTGLSNDQLFWREYIDYVIGYTLNRTRQRPESNIAGCEPRGWPEGSGPNISGTLPTAYDVDGTGTIAADPVPYSNYMTNPLRPRGHFWFGPITMMDFIAANSTNNGSGRNWTAGTAHESQCWQLKAAMNSALDDIRNNHPNDECGLCFFAYNNFQSARVTTAQNWTNLKNSLFYPNSLLSTVSTVTTEVRPYTTSFGDALTGNIPNSNGGTDPNTGFALAYNLLSPSGGGRRGAAKLVVFETDGVPNAYQAWSYSQAGYNSSYTRTGNGASLGNGNSTVITQATSVIDQIVKNVASDTTSDSGHSLPNTKARVYAIGFGDLFSTPSATFQPQARSFLLTVQKKGNTSASSATAIPDNQIITGAYQRPDPSLPVSPTNPAGRIEKLRDAMQTIMQGGVQVTLIQ